MSGADFNETRVSLNPEREFISQKRLLRYRDVIYMYMCIVYCIVLGVCGIPTGDFVRAIGFRGVRGKKKNGFGRDRTLGISGRENDQNRVTRRVRTDFRTRKYKNGVTIPRNRAVRHANHLLLPKIPPEIVFFSLVRPGSGQKQNVLAERERLPVDGFKTKLISLTITYE